MFDEILNSKKVKLRKYLHKDLKKIQAILKNKPDDLKAQNYKLKADLLMAYMYSVQNYDKKIVLDDVEIELDETISLNDNAQKYYSLYKKSKTSYEHSFSRYKEALDKYNYFDEIIFAIDNSNVFSQLEEIKDELIEIGLINEKKVSKNISPIEKIEFKGFEIYIGKNNKQNDYLISKLAKGEDLWFHGLNFPSSHIILKVPNDSNAPDREVLEFCAQLVKDNSKAKNSGKTSIIMTQRKNLRKPPNTYLGYVTYKNEVEIVI